MTRRCGAVCPNVGRRISVFIDGAELGCGAGLGTGTGVLTMSTLDFFDLMVGSGMSLEGPGDVCRARLVGEPADSTGTGSALES